MRDDGKQRMKQMVNKWEQRMTGGICCWDGKESNSFHTHSFSIWLFNAVFEKGMDWSQGNISKAEGKYLGSSS